MSDLSVSELQAQARRLGFRLVPVTKHDLDRELFTNCTTFEEVRQAMANVSPYAVEPSAIPTGKELEHRRVVLEEMRSRGIDPTKPVRGILDPYQGIVVGKIVPGIAILGGPEIAAGVEPGGRRPLRDGGKDVGYCDNFRVEHGSTVCDVHFNADRPE